MTLKKSFLPPVLLLAFCAAGGAQSTSQQVSGFVRDTSSAVIVGAKVVLRQPSINFVRTVETNDTGFYIVSNIPIGEFELTAEAAGFKKYVQTGLVVTVNSKVSNDIAMQVGTLAESVTVTADAAMVEASSGEVGRLITGTQATSMQLNGRNFTQLLSLLPGVATTNRSSFDLFGGYGSEMSAQSVNGGRAATMSWNVDGVDNKDNGGGGNNFVNVNPDAVAEFKVMTSNYSAEFGQNSGAVVNMALKSGSRDFHGAAYEYMRNDAFDAYAWNATAKQKLRFNNFGGNLGGPIYIPGKFNADRNKLFFFTSMEFKRLRRASPSFWNVPSMAQREGNFSGLAASAWPKDPQNNMLPFAGGIVPSSRFSANSKRLVDNYPTPNYAGAGGNFTYYPNNPLNANQYIVKGDYNISNKHQLTVHWMRDYYTSIQNLGQLVTYDRNIPGVNTSAKWTMIANATTVNTAQFSFSGNVIQQVNFLSNPVFIKDYSRSAQGLTFPTLFGKTSSMPGLGIAGLNSLDVNPQNWNNFNRVFQFKDDFSKIVGSHNLKMGVLLMRSRKNQDNQPQLNGRFSFSPGHPLHSGNSLADALLGNFNTYVEASNGREGWFRFFQGEFYFNDNWRVNQRLTLDLGLRYQLMQPQYAQLQNAVIFDPQYFDPAKAPQVDRASGQIIAGNYDPVNGLAVGGSAFPDFAARRIPNADAPEVQRLFRGLPKEITPWEKGAFGPRIGFAYDLTGKQKTVIRGGAGMFYERLEGNFVFGRINNPPFVQESSIFSANVENPAGGTQRVFPSNISSYNTDLKVPRVANYSFGVQHKLTADTLVDVAFVGTSGWSMVRTLNANQLALGALQKNPGVNANALRPYLGYANITQHVNGANLNYSSLQMQLKKNMARNGLINFAYTWSKAITDASAYGEQPMDSTNAKLDRGLATYDRRHIFVASYVYPLPFWRDGGAWYKVALGGWQVSGVTTMQSGRPLNLTINGDVAGTTTGSQRPNVVGDPFANAKTETRWFAPESFSVPAAGTWGNMGRNAIVGPGTHNWDVSLQKIFTISERVRTEFRAEAYNAPHHFSYWGVNTTINGARPGEVNSATDPRTFQFGLRLTF